MKTPKDGDISDAFLMFEEGIFFYVLNLILPLVCISLLTLTVFFLPAESGEKITFCISDFLTLAVFLTIIMSSFPESSDEISLLNIYVTLQLLYSGTTLFPTVFALRLYYRDPTVSWVYRQLCQPSGQQNFQSTKISFDDRKYKCDWWR